MKLKDFIAKLPIETIQKTNIYENKITLPTEVNKLDFYKNFKNRIEQNTLTNEKAIYVVSSSKSYLEPINNILLKKVYRK